MAKIVVNVGHKKGAGAVSVGGVSESAYNTDLAALIAPILRGMGHTVIIQQQRGAYSHLPAEINAHDPDVIVSLHFNSASPRAKGTETLYYSGSKNGLRLAKAVQAEMVAALGLPDRGARSRVKGQRGSLVLRKTKAPCVICEPFFGSNYSDWQTALNRKAELAQAIARGIAAYCSTST